MTIENSEPNTIPDFNGRRWISVIECARICGLHPMSVRKMIARGVIKAVRIGRSVRVDRKNLELDLERQISGQAPAMRAKAHDRGATRKEERNIVPARTEEVCSMGHDEKDLRT